MKNLKISALALITIISFSSCSSDDSNGPVNEEEVITTVTATFTPVGGGTPIILRSRDLDGDGPDAPVITVSDNFTVGTAYNGTVTFLNELENPAGNITSEVLEEGIDHQLFYHQTGLGTFSYADEDVAGDPIGLQFTYTAASAPATGGLTITLRHQPNKGAEGVAGGIIDNAGGSTDAEVSFNVVVE